LLREAARDRDAERARRAQECVRLIEKTEAPPLPTAAPRMVAMRRPAGAAEVLLGYLPFAESEGLTAEVQSALNSLAVRDTKPDPILLRFLEDKLPLRRAAAAEALARSPSPEARQAARKLLEDADLPVRLRAALALAAARERDAVPVLIDLLGDLPPDQVGPAQEALHLLAGDKAPNVVLGTDTISRQKYKEAWAAWWKEHGARVDLARLETTRRQLGYTLLVQVASNGIGRVIEVGPDGKIRWQIDNLQYPVDAYVLPSNRVLIAEYNGQKVTERDLQGNILWQKAGFAARLTNAQRLANGNTFIATQNQLIEVDRSGKEVFTHGRPNHDIMAAYKAGNGQIIFLTSAGLCVRLDASGKELKSFATGQSINWTSGLDVLPNGRILVSHHDRGRVVEYDLDGRPVWEATAPQLTTPTRLSNGNTLIASHSGMRAYELDPRGKIVWEYKDSYHQFRARRR
jgi:hypothetical protein